MTPAGEASRLIAGFAAENALEDQVTSDPELLAGLAWGEPREAHPEGAVGNHVAELLETIDADGETGERRDQLRFIALVHDSFKYRQRDWLPRHGRNHHAFRARRFAERYTDDERLLATIELHDRPYHLWRKMRKRGKLDTDAFEDMLRRLPDPELFQRFIEVDGASEAKDPEPIRWLRAELEKRGLIAAAG
ncbi:MAG TPA: HD domain-containing protein [Thermoleophilaceae bacterium]